MVLKKNIIGIFVFIIILLCIFLFPFITSYMKQKKEPVTYKGVFVLMPARSDSNGYLCKTN